MFTNPHPEERAASVSNANAVTDQGVSTTVGAAIACRKPRHLSSLSDLLSVPQAKLIGERMGTRAGSVADPVECGSETVSATALAGP